jgi:hypothetical protein
VSLSISTSQVVVTFQRGCLPSYSCSPSQTVALALQSKTYGGASAGVGQMAQPDAQPVEEYEYVWSFASSGI